MTTFQAVKMVFWCRDEEHHEEHEYEVKLTEEGDPRPRRIVITCPGH